MNPFEQYANDDSQETDVPWRADTNQPTWRMRHTLRPKKVYLPTNADQTLLKKLMQNLPGKEDVHQLKKNLIFALEY
ncbi:hypothetical protein P879_10364 [Paragonimus westermani]|uniref:Uncharacterized protein n=1 Tax=Paragonimus westermani TaxID=34504 RepID=A0A8T0D8R4_9TREM|nr:hypothetical protein P879_10364 [Paragonimus westermani]